MELCENGELFELLAKVGPVDDAVCKVYFHQLILGIHYLHGEVCAAPPGDRTPVTPVVV